MYKDLKLSDRARVIEMAVKSGITDLDTIEQVYNTFAQGGPKGDIFDDGGDLEGEAPKKKVKFDKPVSWYVSQKPEQYQSINKISPEYLDKYFYIDDDGAIRSNLARDKFASRRAELKNSLGEIEYNQDNEIMLTTDAANARYRTGRISTDLLDYIYDNAARAKIPFKEAVGLAGKESTLGIGRGYKRGQSISPINLYSYWAGIGAGTRSNQQMKKLDQIYKQFYNGEQIDMEALAKTEAEYQKLYDNLHEFQGDNLVKAAYDYYKAGKYNPGEAGYDADVIRQGEAILSDRAVQKWLKSKKAYSGRGFSDGGSLDWGNGRKFEMGGDKDGKSGGVKDWLRKKAVDYYYNHTVKPAIDKYGLGEVRLRLYDHVSPFSYDNADIRVEKALSTPHLGGTDRKWAGEDIRFSDSRYRDDIWRTYLGVPESAAHISGWNPDRVVESKYRPTIGGDQEKYYTINRDSQYYTPYFDTKEGLFGGGKDDELVNMALSGEPELPYTADGAWPMRYGETRQSDILGRYFGDHAVSRGMDPLKGDYVSFYDLWDLAPSEGNNRSGGADESHGIGTPIPFYDRLYLDDYFGVNSRPQNPDEYYGGYIMPTIITAERKADGGKIHIKPENRGKFTALKKRTGHSASWFKAHGTPAQKKMAVFALNAKKWKHGNGGHLMTKL